MDSKRRKMALVIGNDSYKQTPLTNCVNDAIDISNALVKIGFHVRIEMNINCDSMTNGIEKFLKLIMPNDLVVFFFAGYAVHWENQNYLLPYDDDQIKDFIDLKNKTINAQHTLELLSAKNPYAIVFLLDCFRSYSFPTLSSNIMNVSLSPGLVSMSAVDNSLIFFSCTPGQRAVNTLPNGRNGVFTDCLLRHLMTPGISLTIIISDVILDVASKTYNQQIPNTVSSLPEEDIYLVSSQIENMPHVDTVNTVKRASIQYSKISPFARWNQNGETVAGGRGEGKAMNQLERPISLVVDDNETLIIADSWNHRVLKWKIGNENGHVIAGGHGLGFRLNQLHLPTDMLIDKETNSLMICEWQNRRVLRWSCVSGTKQGEIFISNIDCFGLAMDQQGCFYISDIEKHEVRRYETGDKKGKIVAGGHGKGHGLHQLNWPTYIYVDRQQALYISDYGNHRVVKWNKNANEGIIVAGGYGEGRTLAHLLYPKGILVDQFYTLYVVDSGNNRVVRWTNGAKQGTVVVDGNGKGEGANQLNNPWGLSFDLDGNLYVVDHGNHRIQRFSIEHTDGFN